MKPTIRRGKPESPSLSIEARWVQWNIISRIDLVIGGLAPQVVWRSKHARWVREGGVCFKVGGIKQVDFNTSTPVKSEATVV